MEKEAASSVQSTMSKAKANQGSFDEKAVVEEIIAGNSNAYRRIVEKYSARVLAFCRSRMRSEEDARDAAQEVFIRAYASLASFRSNENFASWLFAIAANNVRTHFRLFSSRKHKEEAFAKEIAVAPIPDPAEEAEQNLRAEALRQAVASLPLDLRKPVELYYFAELSVEETASVLKLGQEAVKSRLFRARKALRQAIEKSKASSHPFAEPEPAAHQRADHVQPKQSS